jgi:hypothetical protein
MRLWDILVAKWRYLKTELQVDAHHVDKIVRTVCLLHNIILDKEAVDETVLMTQTSEDHHSHDRGSRRYNHATRGAYDVRDRFKQYFNGVGAGFSKRERYLNTILYNDSLMIL